MENTKDWEKKPLINELTQGKELVNQLRLHFSSSSSAGEELIGKILCTFDNALSMLNWNGSEAETWATTGPISGITESPQSCSPPSDDSFHRDMYKKRKSLPRWTEQVRVCSGTGLEGPLDDGYSWRKYGQKDILGATYPRGYYRCTHRNVHGCLATKQVQRSDKNPSIFDVTYRGKHTCIQAARLIQASAALDKQAQKQNQENLLEQKEQAKQSGEILLNFRTGLKVKTENLDTQELRSSSFSFPSTTSFEDCNKSENNIFSSISLENNLMGTFSPFISPTTSESNYFSPCHMSNIGGRMNFQNSESDLTEIISAATSTTSSPVLDLDFTLDFDTNFPFDTPNFFS